MNYKKLALLLVIVISIFLLLSYVFQPNYSIPEATKHIEVMDDGSCVITEEIVMDIKGSVNGTYRDLPVSDNQEVTNISVETPGYYNEVELGGNITNTRIRVWLYNDKEHTEKINNQRVPVIYKYTYNNAIKVYDDIADFQYMSWGNHWDSSVSTLKTYIKIPGDNSQTQVFNNPDTHIKQSGWKANGELETIAENIPPHTTLEQRILMPTTYFKSTKHAQVIHDDAKSIIEEDQKNYANKKFYENIIYKLMEIVVVLDFIVPLAIYLIYGRETKTGYDAEYEYDVPMDLKPVEANCLFYIDVGTVYEDAFDAVLLDLINNRYFKIVSSNTDDTILRLTDKNTSGLEEYELDIINYLDSFKDSNGDISLASIADNETYDHYKQFKNDWKKKANDSISDTVIKRYFDDKGTKIFGKALLILFILSVILTILANIVTGVIPIIESRFYFYLIVFMAIPVGIYLLTPNTYPGRWTPEGKVASQKWENFRKYITDYSLINEKPPESVQLWGKYLVYAATLGKAKQATDTLQEYIRAGKLSDEQIATNNLVLFASNGGYNNLTSSIDTIVESSYSDSGDYGSSGGGGFGGGGGGTF
ncbi:MAG: DUF2207 domain-containing protein [Methanosphaera sp.]|nr:DUF2207 domain-containing protein [Methanosphaera sp.]